MKVQFEICTEKKYLDQCIKKTSLVKEKSCECESCGDKFVNKKNMEDHLRKFIQKKYLDQKAVDIEKNISDQTIKLTKSILDLKETELEEKLSCKRECKPGCKIFHTKHNWSKTYSNKYLQDLEVIRNAFVENSESGAIPKSYLCGKCNKTYKRVRDLKMHRKSNHNIKKKNKHENQESIVNLEKVDDILIVEEDSVDLKDSSSDNNVETADMVVPNLCYICLLSFISEENLKEHMHKHSGVKLLPSILKKVEAV